MFDFPVGTVLIKTFAFAADMRRPTENVRFLETRLLIRRADGWIALPYVWNEAQTEARLSVIGANVPVSFTNEARRTPSRSTGPCRTSTNAAAATPAPAATTCCRSGRARAI